MIPTRRRARRHPNQPGLLLQKYSRTSQPRKAMHNIEVSFGSGMLQRRSPTQRAAAWGAAPITG